MRNSPESEEELEQLDPAQANKLLRLGLSDTSSVIGNLVYRLRRTGGTAWFEKTLHAAVGISAAEVLSGKTAFSQLEALKNHGKLTFASCNTLDEQLRGLACYFVAIAIAKDQNDFLLSSRPAHELSAALLDIATALPEEWAEVFGRAALTLDT